MTIRDLWEVYARLEKGKNTMFDDDDLPQITRTLVPESDRVNVSGRIFGEHFPLQH